MYARIAEKLAAGAIIVLDGGTGTEIERRGAPMSEESWCAAATLSHGNIVRAVHEDYIRAGAEIIAANTYGSSPFILDHYGKLADLAGLDAALSVHHDFDEVHGWYVRGELGREFELRRALALETALWLGWSDDEHSFWLYRTHTSSLADLGAHVGLRLDLDDVTSARLGVSGSSIVGQDLRDWFDPRIDADRIWATLGVGWAF